MEKEIIEEIQLLNPWIDDSDKIAGILEGYLPREQQDDLLCPEWDDYWILLVGPRRSGKTTLGFYLSRQLVQAKRYTNLLYLNFDYLSLRNACTSPLFLSKLLSHFKLTKPVVFLDEVQRVANPGLLLKAIADLKLPIKMIASGSSQLEIKSQVQEHLTGREIESLVLPLSRAETPNTFDLEQHLLFGSYPRITLSERRQRLLNELYKRYISKDIVEILKIGKPDVLEKLISLIAHSTGQLVNYQQLALDCKVTIPTIQNYLSILEATYIIKKITPFSGNKRTEVTKNPVYYFIDNGFRNQALRNFLPLDSRTDAGFLVECFVFQELYKFKNLKTNDFDIFYWRTKSGTEVDFVLYKNMEQLIPVEVKYQKFNRSGITRGFRSFLQAYQPKNAIIVTKSWQATETIENCKIQFIPLAEFKHLTKLFDIAW